MGARDNKRIRNTNCRFADNVSDCDLECLRNNQLNFRSYIKFNGD